MILKDLNKFYMFSTTYGSCMAEVEKGEFYSVVDVEALLKEIGYLTDLNLKNDSHRHDIVFKGVNITYRLSVTKSHFWIYNKDTGGEIQYISHDRSRPGLYENWESFMEDFWSEILEDMR